MTTATDTDNPFADTEPLPCPPGPDEPLTLSELVEAFVDCDLCFFDDPNALYAYCVAMQSQMREAITA